MKEHKLLQCLCLVKDVLLLKCGELFLAFFDNFNILNNLNSSSDSHCGINCKTRRRIVDRPPPKNESEIHAREYDVNEAFPGAARSLGMDDEELDGKSRRIAGTSKTTSNTSVLQNMSFTTTQNCLQVDVIEAQFSHLIHRIHSDQEVQLIQIAHEAYIAGLQAQALLFMPNIKLCISQLLNHCCQFVQSSNDQHDANVDADYFNTDECHTHKLLIDEQEITRKFYTQAKLLYDLLNISCLTGAKSSVGISSGYTVVGHRENPVSLSSNNATTTGHHYSGTTDLNQFLLRLDFNHFYSDSPENLI
ncbi:hypothetical protein MN116_000948 [Schistosoma mekongi]|uniref:Gamma tubulin complex component C-terminal domain-containing protein n=1 Tax=Schistosoma mekongi TaxID=38744 RepID=A0AAE1ZK85_SCHME|nr:hypothetical protein MN116_000948 [Schistosoma mekongi]